VRRVTGPAGGLAQWPIKRVRVGNKAGSFKLESSRGQGSAAQGVRRYPLHLDSPAASLLCLFFFGNGEFVNW
jgi:hypothetical protein